MSAQFRSVKSAQVAVLSGVAAALQAIAAEDDLAPELKPGVQFSLRVIKATTARIAESEGGAS